MMISLPPGFQDSQNFAQIRRQAGRKLRFDRRDDIEAYRPKMATGDGLLPNSTRAISIRCSFVRGWLARSIHLHRPVARCGNGHPAGSSAPRGVASSITPRKSGISPRVPSRTGRVLHVMVATEVQESPCSPLSRRRHGVNRVSGVGYRSGNRAVWTGTRVMALVAAASDSSSKSPTEASRTVLAPE